MQSIHFKRFICAALTCAALPFSAHADHMPGQNNPDIAPNMLACMIAVDDASDMFRPNLQIQCFQHTLNMCDGGNGKAGTEESIICLNFENRQSIDFLDKAVQALPENPKLKGFTQRRYKSSRQEILDKIQVLRAASEPQDLKQAVQRTVEITADLTTLFRLARETKTSLEEFLTHTDDHHEPA